MHAGRSYSAAAPQPPAANVSGSPTSSVCALLLPLSWLHSSEWNAPLSKSKAAEGLFLTTSSVEVSLLHEKGNKDHLRMTIYIYIYSLIVVFNKTFYLFNLYLCRCMYVKERDVYMMIFLLL
ncbi:Uncharacterized protein TCM_014805 [Theobroma cacao]|uniref:Uncharacterized protein n=1 Tax=Theobroma cacao TaxID=3641 RepID=A0A061G6T2_THECC|nr:Uncharacterized protein TCM_014805 [Theobroma cacao]